MGDNESFDAGGKVAEILQAQGLTLEQAQAWLSTIDLSLPSSEPPSPQPTPQTPKPETEKVTEKAKTPDPQEAERLRLQELADAISNDAAMTKVPVNANPTEIAGAKVAEARAEVTKALKDPQTRTEEDIRSARGLLPKVLAAITQAEQAAAVRLEKDRLEALASAVRKEDVMTKAPRDATAKEIKNAGLAAARKAVTDALKARDTRTEADINTARALLHQVQAAFNKAEEVARKRVAYETRFQQFKDDYEAMRDILGMPGVPKSTIEAFYKAEADVVEATNKALWVKAKNKLAALETATQAVKVIHTAGAAYFTAYAGIKADFDEAVKSQTPKMNRLKLVQERFVKSWQAVNGPATATPPDWDKARAGVAALGAASVTLKDAAALLKSEEPSFLTKFGTVLNLPAAQAIAKSPPKSLKESTVKTFTEAFRAVNDAKNNGEFKVAEDGIDALKLAITNLLAAKASYDSEKDAFERAMAAVTHYAGAKQLADAKSPAVTARIGAFNTADKAVETKKSAEKWTEATALVPALGDAVEKLIAARDAHNTGLTPKQKDAFKKKLAGLKKRTDLAQAGGATAHIEDPLKKNVREGLAAINTLVGAGNCAEAEVALPTLVTNLGLMEKGQEAYEKHKKKFDKAEKGPVAKGLKAKLTPAKLVEERKKSLAATRARIVKYADKGRITDKADPLVIEWANEAEAWKEAQRISDNLNTGTEPDTKALEKIGKKKGGGKVLDALINGLPDNRPEKFLKAALKTRYGVEVTRFDKKHPDNLQDYTGSTAISPDVPDKALKKMYQMFGKVPVSNVKGKVKDLIHFDEDAGGAAATPDTIWMYCGRPDDPNASKQRFSQENVIVPKGEEVEEDFKPVNDDEVPYFDFAALHEVGHVVDAAQGVMAGSTKDIAGWQTHSIDDVAQIAADHFKYNLQFIKDTLANKDSTPPTDIPAVEGGVSPAEWETARKKVVDWCQLVRESRSLWFDAGLSKMVALGGRVYQEAYFGRPWVSYEYAARSKGISGYQFRAPGEWFAELYAAFFSGKLKKTHPYAAWLKPLKKIT